MCVVRRGTWDRQSVDQPAAEIPAAGRDAAGNANDKTAARLALLEGVNISPVDLETIAGEIKITRESSPSWKSSPRARRGFSAKSSRQGRRPEHVGEMGLAEILPIRPEGIH